MTQKKKKTNYENFILINGGIFYIMQQFRTYSFFQVQ